MFKVMRAAAVALVAVLGSASAHAGLIQNGSFEINPTELSKFYQHTGFKYDARTYDQLAASDKWGVFATLPGWNSLFGNQIELHINGSIPGKETAFGNNYVELDTHFNVVNGQFSNESNVGISQNLTGLTVGATYELSFWYRSRTTLADDNIMNVFWLPTDKLANYADFTAKTVDLADDLSNHNQWTEYKVKLVATSTNMTVGFGAAGNAGFTWKGQTSVNGNKSGAMLDNVDMREVPLPATAALMLGGLLLMAQRRRRV